MYSNVFLRILPTGSALPSSRRSARLKMRFSASSTTVCTSSLPSKACPMMCLAALQEHGAEHGALGVEIVRRDARRNFERAHARVSAHLGSMRPDGALGLVVSSTKKLTKSMVCG